MALRLPGTTATISGWVFSVGQVPIGASNARSGTDTGTNMPTHGGPTEDGDDASSVWATAPFQ